MNAQLAVEDVIAGPDACDGSRRSDNALGESAYRFGPGLVGVLHRPCHEDGHVQDVAVILLNAGLVRRIGPYRQYVLLARLLARAGFTVLRYDQSGLGDSASASREAGDRRLREVRAAMTLVGAETGHMRFVLGGLCSGADDAFHIAVQDSRVVGTLLLDGPGYKTAGFWWRHLLPRVFSPRRWRALLGHVGKLRTHEPGLLDYRDFPPQADARLQLQSLVERGVRMLFLYTSGSYYYVNHRSQLAAALGDAARAPAVTVEFWRDCDHTFYLQQDRTRMFAYTLGWMQDAFGTRKGRPGPTPIP
ncbi:alpha/beta hydrolase [Lysobacter sp. SG-8]|uniref:Alpha/beta hydrolase n=1 Tax=Marilutibacter penaei TaxID=2759900 RepID=A0A7W3U1S7_9GAMM|nr:alpha/beta hydrolase [Lysobacter penaei]MBB1087401.1 alpha/beta hydrolase [Lysobacter penaei]